MTIRTAIRSLSAQAGFAVTTIFILAVGIGGTTAIYSVVYHLIIRPIPVEDPSRLVRIWKTREDLGFFITLNRDEAEAVRNATQLEALEAFRSREVILEQEGAASAFVIVNEVAHSFFFFVDVTPVLGRTIQPEDGLTGVPPVTLISHDFWTSRYAGSPEVLGEEIRIDRVARRIVGVLPSGFRFPNQEGDFWIPLGDSSSGEERYGLNTLAVLKRGVTPEALKAEVDGLLAGVSQDGQVWPSAFQPTVPPESIHSRPCSRF